MKKIIFIFTALPLLSFADIYSCDELLNGNYVSKEIISKKSALALFY